MDLKEFIKNFADQFEDTDPAEITAITEFKNLEEWSSLSVLSLIAMVDEAYGVIINGDDIQNATTVEDLFRIVSEK